MIFIQRRHLGLIFVTAVLAAAAGFWDYIDALHHRFPDVDFSRAGLGLASWYSESDPHINDRTANNEMFDDQALTCASWDYDFGEKLLVINALNGKGVVCRVNDRGPGKRLRRKIDLTKAAFKKIANPKRGLIPVTIFPVRKQS